MAKGGNGLKKRTRRSYRRALAWIRRNVAPGYRSVIGLLLVLGGIFGFLPVLGFWMIPLGLAAIWMDIRRMRRQRAARDHNSRTRLADDRPESDHDADTKE